MIGPEIDEAYEAVEVSYSIRILDDSYSGRHEIDGKYRFPEVEAEIVMEEVYPQIVERFEDEFPNAEIQAYELEQNCY